MVGKGTVDAINMNHEIASATLRVRDGRLLRCYIDLTKAYDKVSRPALWTLLDRLGFPPTLVVLIKALHEGATACVKVNGELSRPITLSTGLKQGSVLSPMLFNVMLGAIVHAARTKYEQAGLGVQILQNDGMLHGRRRGSTDSPTFIITDIEFADDCVLFAESESDLQQMVNHFHIIATAYGQEISIRKTKIMVVQSEKTAALSQSIPSIMIEGEELEVVQEFRYLGSIDSADGYLTAEISKRKMCMWATYHRIKSILLDRHLKIYTRLAIYNATVVPSGIYACQTWNISVKDMAAVEAVQSQILRRMFHLSLRTPTKDVLLLARGKNGKIAPIECRIRQSQLRYYGHVMRKNESDPIRRTVHCERPGVSKLGRNYECWRSAIVKAGELFGMNIDDDTLINDRIQWRRQLNTHMEHAVARWRDRQEQRD
jgi:hypothetical protein